ncbi:Peptide deformylase 1B, chloroplastic [Dionaea muscipula]
MAMSVSYVDSLHAAALSKSPSPLLSRWPTPRHRFSAVAAAPRVFFSTTTSPRRRRRAPVLAMAKRVPFRRGDFATPVDLRFEPPLKIVEYPDTRLRLKNKAIRTFDDDLNKLVDAMFDMMYKSDGIGLSAPQVGINIQLMVFNPAGERDKGKEIVLINPRVIKYSKDTTIDNEGCLSFPGIYAIVQRPVSVTIEAQDVTGAKYTINLLDLPARIFQHEFDHLKGVLFFERMTKNVLEEIRADLQALEKKYEKNTGLPSPERAGKPKRIGLAMGFRKS